MRTSQFSERQILDMLKQVDIGQKVGEVCRVHGISEGTYYRWKAKYGGVDASQLQRLRQLEDENGRLKRIVADLTLDNTALKDVLRKNW
jgi:putative transposase